MHTDTNHAFVMMVNTYIHTYKHPCMHTNLFRNEKPNTLEVKKTRIYIHTYIHTYILHMQEVLGKTCIFTYIYT